MKTTELLFSFRRRIDRKQFWTGALYVALPMLVLAVVVRFGLPALGVPDDSFWLLREIVATILGLVLTVMVFALLIKRLHDFNRSGWWLLLLILVAAIISVLAVDYALTPTMGRLAANEKGRLVADIVLIAFIVAIGCWPGTPGPNSYDEPAIGNGGNRPASP